MEDTTNEVSTNTDVVDTSASHADDITKNKTQIGKNEENKEDKSKTSDDTSKGEFEKTGNAVLDYAIDFIANSGFNPDDQSVKMAYEGNFDLLKAELAQKGVKGWEQIAGLLEKGYKEEVEKQEAFSKSIEDAVSAVFDGDAEYQNKVFEFARENAEKDELDTLNEFLSKSPFAAQVAMSYLKNAYEMSTNKTQQPAEAVHKTATVSTPNTALSPDDFFLEVEKLAGQVGRQNVYAHPEYRQLEARRLAYRA